MADETPFAELSHLVARWRPLTSEEAATAEIKLGDASQLIRDLAPGIDGKIASGISSALTVKSIVCEMVKRAMVAGEGGALESEQQSAGPFARTLNFANPTGDLYLTRLEKKRLGIGSQKAFSIDTTPARHGGR